jgi:hypothetical protein
MNNFNSAAFLSSDDLTSSSYLNTSSETTLPAKRHGGNVFIGEKDFRLFIDRIPSQVRGDLMQVSQLGLKELWLGKSPGNHNRWHHSVGCFNAGLFWLAVLEQDERVPKHCLSWPLDSWEKVRAVVGTALLLHDFGHLPFSHMIEEVLASMNWLPPSHVSGLEATVLTERLQSEAFASTWKWLSGEILGKQSPRPVRPSQARCLVEALIVGRYPVPWIQTIVNSAIDADKIDYIRFDSAFLHDCPHPTRSRLQQENPSQWLAEFLSEQEVNHAGLIRLNGRSAVAAADLCRERMFISDRLYLSPELRVAERMAFEIIQQFVIRSTMSSEFSRRAGMPFGTDFGLRFHAEFSNSACTPGDVGRIKYETVRDNLLYMLPGTGGRMREFPLLVRMASAIQSCPGIDPKYKEFLSRCLSSLQDLCPGEVGTPTSDLRSLVRSSLVREPIVFARSEFTKAREVIRQIQHSYAREALIDLIRLPRLLGAPDRWRCGPLGSLTTGVDYTILVPDGPVESWGPGKVAATPLTDEAVDSLDRPFCRVIVVAPSDAASSRAEYIWDRVRSALMEGGVKLVETKRDIYDYRRH